MPQANNYIKLPNQGNITSNLRLLSEIHNACDYSDANGHFRKSDVAEIAANALLITTGNKFGSEIITTIRSRNINDSDNSPLQNTKMRMQLLRILGLVAADFNSEIYALTELGDIIASDNTPNDKKTSLIRELFMCITTSSESYDFNCSEGFHCFLGLQICYALASLDYKLGVDEMPILTTYDYRDIMSFVHEAQLFRDKQTTFPTAHQHFPKTKSGNPLAQAKNLTRTINQILRYCNIIKPKYIRIGKQNFYECTDFGRMYVNKIKSLWDADKLILKTPFEFRKMNVLDQRTVCKQGLDNILIRSDFMQGKDTGLYFSPYQLLPEVNVLWLLGKSIREHPTHTNTRVQAINSSLSLRELRLKAIYKDCDSCYLPSLSEEHSLIMEIQSCETIEQKELFISQQMEIHALDDKTQFYPYIHSLLRIIGLDCKGEIGRFDALSYYNEHIIPMEIKSNTEDTSYNQKGLRQAIENKICCYNQNLVDDMEYGSLVLGYRHANNDADIKKLIDAAHERLKVKIIALDLTALLTICVKVVCDKIQLDLNQFLKGYGLVLENL